MEHNPWSIEHVPLNIQYSQIMFFYHNLPGRAKKTLATFVRRLYPASPTPPTSMLQAYASLACPNINERFFCTLQNTQKPPTLK